MFESLFNRFTFKSKYSLEITGNLINNYIIPNCQRPIHPERLASLSNNIYLKFNPITPLYFCVYNNNRYIIDGQHRLLIYQKFNLIDKKIPIIDIYIDKEEDIYEYFKLINDTMPLHEMYTSLDVVLSKKEIILEVYNYFLENYPKTFKYKGKQRPYLCQNTFLDQLNEIYDNELYNITNSRTLIDLIENLNQIYSTKDINYFPKKGKTNNKNIIDTLQKHNCLYLGMVPNDWPNHLIKVPEYISESEITQAFRQAVWIKYVGKEYTSLCLCCGSNEITVHNFECGHIISRKNGGDITINNIVPICSFCNRAMGAMHMLEFMQKNNYNTERIIL